MTGDLIYAVGALASLFGWVFVAILVYRLLFVALTPKGQERTLAAESLRYLIGGAGLCLILGLAIPKDPAGSKAAAFGQTAFAKLPVIWPIFPFPAWGALICLTLVASKLILGAIRGFDRSTAKSVVGYLIAVFIFGFWHKTTSDPLTIVRGTIPLSLNFVVGTALLLVATFLIMIFAGRVAKVRGFSSIARSHILLLLGSVVFGVPFLWAVITSFKEDRDMSSPDGLVWIPKVSQTVPFRDPADPLYEIRFEGYTAKANLIKKEGDNLVLDIQRPLVIRGRTATIPASEAKEIDRDAPLVTAKLAGETVSGMVVKELEDGRRQVKILEPSNLKDKVEVFNPGDVEPIRKPGLRTANYGEALEYLPPESNSGLVYLRNTLILVVLSVIGTLLSSSLVAYAFARMQFPSKKALFNLMLATMMLPGAVTLMPRFLIFRDLGWIDTLLPIWVPAFLGSAFNIFMLREFFSTIPMELEDAGKIDGCSYIQSFWRIMLPQVKPALAVITIWTFMGVWNNFMEPLIYVNSPEKMPIAYALQLYNGDRFGEPGLLMAFSILCMLPVLALFFFAQRYFIEGVSLSGLGGR